MLVADKNLNIPEFLEEDARLTRILLGMIENIIMIAVKKLLIFQFNIRATGWWIASYSFSYIMFLKDFGMNIGKIMALSSSREVSFRNSIFFKIFLGLVSIGFYFGLMFGFQSPFLYYLNRGEEQINVIEIIQK